MKPDVLISECADGQRLEPCVDNLCFLVRCSAGLECVMNHCGGCNPMCVPIKPIVRCTSWTDWLDRDDPSGTGDWETLSDLQQDFPGRICDAPTAIQARVIGTGQDALATGENFVFFDATTGFVCRKEDQKDGMCLDYEVRFCCPDVVPDCPAGSWTPWFDRDNPSATGDWETLTPLRKENPGRICFSPTAVHARVISTQVEASLAGESIHWYDTTTGFACINEEQDDDMCLEYEVRFCCPPCPNWTPWFDRDDPSATGDWEVLSHLRPENPGEICREPTDIEVRVIATGLDAFLTGEVFAFYDVTTGFVCKKEDQPDDTCLDYEVRFCCPPTCDNWTPWFDRDNPSATGDWESLVNLRTEYPGQICPRPTDVHARVIATGLEASLTGETFVYYDTTNGFACRNVNQRDQRCLDYEVRFCCPPMTEPYCPSGYPFLPNYYCGRGGVRCPPGYYCEIEPTDRWAVCCPTGDPYCPSGDPFLPNYYCGRGGQRCPPGYYCEIEPTDRWAVCCRTEGQCPDVTGQVGICVEECSSDFDCPEEQICCSNGCGHTCQDSVLMPMPEPRKLTCSIDLIIVIDMSPSLSQAAFFFIKRFIIDLILCLIELCVDVGIGIITYDCVPTWYLPVRTYGLTDPRLIGTASGLTYTRSGSGSSRTGLALRYMTDTYKADVRDASAVVMTSGESDDDVTAEAAAARAAGIGLYSVAAGNPLLLNAAALVNIAGGRDRVFGRQAPCDLAERMVRDLCGRCPEVTGPGLCVEMCGNDSDCPAGQLCCSNGCGHTCQDPVFG
ncbi:uncharacterized protein LOC144866630 [Branchiostoma floridae x Branchiostoma japonicum]